jgi:hypothetical protein
MGLAVVLVAALAGNRASGATINEPFDAPVGGIPSGFVLKSLGDGSTTQIVEPGTSGRPDNYLQMGRVVNSHDNAALYYTAGQSTATADNQFGDFSGSVILRFGVSTSGQGNGYGLVLRARNPTFSSMEDYWVVIAPKGLVSTTANLLTIYKNPSAYDDTGDKLATSSSTFSNLSVDTDYKITFTASGSTLSVSLYGGSNFSDLLATVSTDQATDYQSGYIGLRSGSASQDRFGYFRDLSVVPEPAELGLLAVGAGGVLLKRRRK